MEETLRTLLGLQELDTDIFRVGEEVKRLPKERAKRQTEIDARLSAINDLDQEISGLATRIKEIEDLTTIQRQRLRKLEGEAANSRGDAALLAAFQHEMRTLRRDISEAEEEGLQLVERQDEFNARRNAIKAEVEELETVFAEYAANVEKELAEAQARLEKLESDRKGRLRGDIPPNVLNTYERLIQAREGVAMAFLEGRTCQGCYMEVPTNIYVRLARGQDLVQCPSCDRILYLSRL